ncbi:hypothetical protein ABK040_009431 [Willaertia magna]
MTDINSIELDNVAIGSKDKDEHQQKKLVENDKEDSLLCVVSEEKFPKSYFQNGHQITSDNYEMFSLILNDFDEDEKIKNSEEKRYVCDQVYKSVESRYNKYHKPKLENFVNGKDLIRNCLMIFAMLFIVIVFLVLASLPIWAIESFNEIQELRKNFNATAGDTNPSNSTDVIARKWTYGNSIYYCITTFTSIGYGDMTPSTRGGRGYIAVFGLAGLALTGAMLVIIGSTFVENVKTLMLWSTKMFYKIFNLITSGDKQFKKTDKIYVFLTHPLTHILLFALIIVAYILVCAVIFMEIEGWQYQDACWYGFVTLTTIGYGDFFPKTPGGKVFYIFFTIIGLGFVAVQVGLVSEFLFGLIKKFKVKTKELVKSCFGKCRRK